MESMSFWTQQKERLIRGHPRWGGLGKEGVPSLGKNYTSNFGSIFSGEKCERMKRFQKGREGQVRVGGGRGEEGGADGALKYWPRVSPPEPPFLFLKTPISFFDGSTLG